MSNRRIASILALIVAGVFLLFTFLAYLEDNLHSSAPVTQRVPASRPRIPVVFSSKDFKADFGDLVDVDPSRRMSVVITPLKGQTGYGELRCNFYSKANHLVAVDWVNWNYNIDANPMDKTLSVPIDVSPVVRAKCFITTR
jgi:hypothetical protein